MPAGAGGWWELGGQGRWAVRQHLRAAPGTLAAGRPGVVSKRMKENLGHLEPSAFPNSWKLMQNQPFLPSRGRGALGWEGLRSCVWC